MNIENEEIKILRIKDLMECLSIGKDKAYALMKSRSFPSTRIGKTYFVTENSLKMWLKDNAGKNVNI